ncbi:MAG: hypothetical protein HY270_01870 [Deltaproteobacteria bacterium]|nr:hypothetical protein [Deltaproteobacteria bacterium]
MTQSNPEAKQILQDYFDFKKFSRAAQAAAYIGLDPTTYRNWPVDVLFATFHPGIGLHYSRGGYMLALHDYNHRGVDLNHAMGQSGELDFPADLGECLMPMVIEARELDGVFFLDRQLAVFAVEEDGVRYGLAFRNTNCLFKGYDQKIYTCMAKPMEDYKFYEPPLRGTGVPTPSAVIAFCTRDEECKLPDGFFERYGVAAVPPGDEFFDVDLSHVEAGKRIAHVFCNVVASPAPAIN